MTDHVRNPVLEAAIRADRADPAPCQVYADWLQERGSMFGELIMLQQAIAERQDAGTARRAGELLATLDLAAKGVSALAWRGGLWSQLVVARPTPRPLSDAEWRANKRSEDPEAIDPRQVAQLFGMPLCAALDELHIGSLHDFHNGALIPGLLAEAGAHAWASELRRLTLSDARLELGFGSFMTGPVGRVISAAFPRLHTLGLDSGEAERGVVKFSLEGLALPALRELAVGVYHLSRDLLEQVYVANVPNLERLDLSINDDLIPHDFAPLLERRCFPRLRALGIRNTVCGDELLAALPGSPLAAQLETLDLSSMMISTRPVRVLARHAGAFPRLRALHIGDNHITTKALETLRAAFQPCAIVSKRQWSPQSLAHARRYDPLDE